MKQSAYTGRLFFAEATTSAISRQIRRIDVAICPYMP